MLFFVKSTAQFSIDSFKILHKKDPYAQKIKAYLFFGETVGKQNFDDVISIASEGILIAVKQGDSLSVGILKRHIGESYYYKGNYNEAASYFYASIKIFEESKDGKNLANSYNALAKLYRKTRDLTRSLQNYDKAMSIFKALNDSAGIAMIYNESGVVFEYEGKYKQAAERYTASLKIDEKRKDTVGICYALSNLAGVYTIQNNFKVAEEYLKRSLTFRKKMNDVFSLALNYSELGNTYFSSKQFEKAKLYIDTSNDIAVKMGYPELRGNNFDLLAKIAEGQGEYQKALSYNKLKTSINDSIYNIEKTKKIEELNTRYETEKKERTIQEQKNQIVLQNTIMVAAIILVILGSLLAYTQYRRYQLRQEAKMQAESLRQQDNAVKAVMDAEEAERKRIATDLHDGVGQIMSAAKMNLSAFEHHTKFQTDEQRQYFQKIISLIDSGCKEVRSVSHNMMPNALLKNNLSEAINEFISKLDNKTLKVHLHSEGFEEPFDTSIETVLYRVIEECVNNVIKHSEASVLDISLVRESNEITATVEDNGKGFEVNKNTYNDGIGLKNIITRVEFLKGTVDFTSAPGKGTLVAIYIPV
ncbi:MAG: sensor histidine kinase [Ferruginibacter sp.]|nr:sensor histidine kinase [Ferruginibacter sp.]